MADFIKYFERNNGYATVKELKSDGFHTSVIKKMADEGVIYKIKPGLYRLDDLPEPETVSFDFVDTAKAVPGSVICLLSALSYYDLTTYMSPSVNIAVERSKKIPKVTGVNIKGYYFSESTFILGINEIKTKYGAVKIYDREKSLCDAFRYRNKIGEDIAYECLKNYVKGNGTDFLKLREYAKICKVSEIVNSSLKTLLG